MLLASTYMACVYIRNVKKYFNLVLHISLAAIMQIWARARGCGAVKKCKRNLIEQWHGCRSVGEFYYPRARVAPFNPG